MQCTIQMKSLVPKRYKCIFVYLRKMQPKFEIYWEMHLETFQILAHKIKMV
jgi:hypothetical protein